jgi:hypothetical protein
LHCCQPKLGEPLDRSRAGWFALLLCPPTIHRRQETGMTSQQTPQYRFPWQDRDIVLSFGGSRRATTWGANTLINVKRESARMVKKLKL